MLNESDIIRSLQNAFPVKGGIGDDAALLPISATESYVISKDILVEHRHFRLTTTDAASLAHKALHVNLSDIAAMGAVPQFVMLGIALPSTLEQAWVDAFLAAFTDACKKEKVLLIGGDTTASERDLFISVTVIGRAENAHLKFRSGVKSGDMLCVAGTLGEAHAGLVGLEKNVEGDVDAPLPLAARLRQGYGGSGDESPAKLEERRRRGAGVGWSTQAPLSTSPPSIPPASGGEVRGALDVVKLKHLRPTAKTAEGAWLGQQSAVTAMMDVSDGLYVDLSRLVKASQVGAVIDLENLHPSPALSAAALVLSLDIRACMLTGGEDYALLLTVSSDSYESLAHAFKKTFGYTLTKIGTITTSVAVELREAGQSVPFTYRPFSHFGEF